MSLYDLKVGDRVQVFENCGRRSGQPEGGWDGEVIKAGRKLLTVKWGRGEEVFRLDTGQYNSKSYPHFYRVKTVEQAAADLRRQGLLNKLNEMGLEIRFHHKSEFTTDKLEAVVKVLEEA
jgi:hypothetical protein